MVAVAYWFLVKSRDKEEETWAQITFLRKCDIKQASFLLADGG